jgi:hypothetical protein
MMSKTEREIYALCERACFEFVAAEECRAYACVAFAQQRYKDGAMETVDMIRHIKNSAVAFGKAWKLSKPKGETDEREKENNENPEDRAADLPDPRDA